VISDNACERLHKDAHSAGSSSSNVERVEHKHTCRATSVNAEEFDESGVLNGRSHGPEAHTTGAHVCKLLIMNGLYGGEGGIRSRAANTVSAVTAALTSTCGVSLKPPEPHQSI
jgi:hypothetical protein